MKLLPIFLKELQQEAEITRKFLTLIPEDKFDWAPHPKSMKMLRLAKHIADLPAWPWMILEKDGLNFETSTWKEDDVNSVEEILAYHTRSIEKGSNSINNSTEEELEKIWSLQAGGHIISQDPKRDVMRMALNQTVHHRAQLGVYLRLLDIPIPGSYGPSADEM
ncbi:DinB family protein [Mucilaginibacter ginkgonis]|uniref:DinB family protein n=1 Tax=Mucilaginibacter ginkgonis TaxID=2682091 RepID=A0A6I4I2G2_9SPHI|nr:DinB family protein [Mucilaginibacter ginkgonis]QQL49193.1 DinB family protein [Mucilaginibacter ginkgonis]